MAERTVRRTLGIRDAELARIGAHFHCERARWGWRRVWVAGRRSTRRVKQSRAVAYAARQRVLYGPATDDITILRAPRIPGARRLETEQPTRRRRKANRTTQVIAVRSRNHAAGDRRRGATTGAAGRARRLPRIA